MSRQSVFLIGPGFIGGEILDHLLEENYKVTTLVRRESANEAFEARGVKVVNGTLDDRSVIEQTVVANDIVFHTATADHLPSVEAVLSGIAQRASKGKQTIYIHTSGASLLGDDSAGDYLSDKIFDDENPEDIDAVPDKAPHRQIDLAIVNGSKALGAKAKVGIMIPPVIYGISSRDERTSIQLPTMVRYSIKHGYAGHIGKGKSVWNQIHVKDLARGYMVLLHSLENIPEDEQSRISIGFVTMGRRYLGARLLPRSGPLYIRRAVSQAPKQKPFPGKTMAMSLVRTLTSSLVRILENKTNRLRKLGWEATEKKSLVSLVEDEIPLILQEKGPYNGYSKAVAS